MSSNTEVEQTPGQDSLHKGMVSSTFLIGRQVRGCLMSMGDFHGTIITITRALPSQTGMVSSPHT